MFERFSDRARVAVATAKSEAERLGHGYVGTQHLLLALSQGDGIAARALKEVGFDRNRFEADVRAGAEPLATLPRHLPFTPRSKQALESALRQALAWHHNYIGTEHLVVAVVRDDSALATKLLAEQGISESALQAAVMRLLDATRSSAAGRTVEDEAIAAIGDDLVGGLMDAMASEGDRASQPARCPRCNRPLAENLAADVIASVGGVDRVFNVAYCRGCGHTLAVLPDQ